MTRVSMDYWEECIREAFEENKILATEEQIQSVVGWVQGAHENYGTAHGHDCIPNPLKLENDRLLKELQKERDKTVCPECLGTGRIILNLGPRSSNTGCTECHGQGYL